MVQFVFLVLMVSFSSSVTDFELGFGVTSKVWDYVFGTVLPVTAK